MRTKAIETKAFGYRFRSRLEARWAIFFNWLLVEWQYEPEGFELPSGRYLPDFLLRYPKMPNSDHDGLEFWAEVKPRHPSEAEMYHLCCLAGETKTPAIMLVGTPGDRHIFQFWKPAGDIAICSTLTLFCHRARPWIKPADEHDHDPARYSPYVNAIEAARSARFEHGEVQA